MRLRTSETVFIRFVPSFQGPPRVTLTWQPGPAAGAGAGAGAGDPGCGVGGKGVDVLEGGVAERFAGSGVAGEGFDVFEGGLSKGFWVRGGREGCGAGTGDGLWATVMYQGCRSMVFTR